eukprot:1158856-Pelagomonas_calceolata.AAC.3
MNRSNARLPAGVWGGRKCHQACTSPPTSPPWPLLMERKDKGPSWCQGCCNGRQWGVKGSLSCKEL